MRQWWHPALKCGLHFAGNLQAELILIRRRYHLEANGHAVEIQSQWNVRCGEAQNIE